MLEITPIQPFQVEAAKRLIYTIAHPMFAPHETYEQAVARWEEDRELADVDDIWGSYFNNGGTFLVMVEGERIVGTGAIRRLEDGICELKRLWFLEEYQGKGLGYRMITRLMEIARSMGYRKMRLQTDATKQTRAVAFYQKLGFIEIPHYRATEDTLSMEIDLSVQP